MDRDTDTVRDRDTERVTDISKSNPPPGSDFPLCPPPFEGSDNPLWLPLGIRYSPVIPPPLLRD
jgi:hypothetical protein